MSVTAHKLGPGTLTFGDTGSPQEFGSAVTAASINPSWAEEDPVIVLSGEALTDEGKAAHTLSMTFYQDYGMSGLVAWTWQNSGKVLPFTFKPRGDQDMTVTGQVQVRAVTIGGDVDTRNTAEAEWKIIGEAELGTSG